jgi:hypothetical protein
MSESADRITKTALLRHRLRLVGKCLLLQVSKR